MNPDLPNGSKIMKHTILNSGTRDSLDSFCHHKITYCKVNFNIPPPPPFERKLWHYDRASTHLLRRSMAIFPWVQHLNIMSNFIPNEVKRIVPRDPPWITKPLKAMLNRKNRFF